MAISRKILGHFLLLVSLLVSGALPALAAEAADVQHYPPADINAPYSPVVRMGALLFLAGQVGRAEDGTIPTGTPAQTHVIMKKIKKLVETHGSSMDRVGKCTVFLLDMADWSSFNAVYTQYFKPGRRPARSAVGMNGLATGYRVEVECIAAVK